jgi:hypothetical protein
VNKFCDHRSNGQAQRFRRSCKALMDTPSIPELFMNDGRTLDSRAFGVSRNSHARSLSQLA